jgi:hypothetical protein
MITLRVADFAVAGADCRVESGGEGAGGDVEVKSWPARDRQDGLNLKQMAIRASFLLNHPRQSQAGIPTKSRYLAPLRRHINRSVA